MQTIGDRIKEARERAGLSQRQLAEAIPCGGAQTQVSNWETGLRVPRRQTVERIADITGTTPAWIMFGGGGTDERQG